MSTSQAEMTPEPTLWDEAQRLLLAACLEQWWYIGDEPSVRTADKNPYVHDYAGGDPYALATGVGDAGHPMECICDGTGKVRSLLYKAIEIAETVPHEYCGGRGFWRDTGGSKPVGEPHPCDKGCNDTGRVPREQPGVVACTDGIDGVHVFEDPYSSYVCDTCGGSGTVPDPSEAGQAARLMACGLLWPVFDAIVATKLEGLFAWTVEHRLQRSDHPGAHAAVLEAVRVIVAQEASRGP